MGGLFGGSSTPTYTYVDKYEYVDKEVEANDEDAEADAAKGSNKRDRLTAANRYGTANHAVSDLTNNEEVGNPYAL